MYGNLQYKIRMKEIEIEKLSTMVKTIEEPTFIEVIKKELDSLKQKEEVLWRQRSKCL